MCIRDRVYAESSFDIKNQLVLAARDVSTKYTRRTMEEYIRITGYIKEFVAAKRGNYLIFPVILIYSSIVLLVY